MRNTSEEKMIMKTAQQNLFQREKENPSEMMNFGHLIPEAIESLGTFLHRQCSMVFHACLFLWHK